MKTNSTNTHDLTRCKKEHVQKGLFKKNDTRIKYFSKHVLLFLMIMLMYSINYAQTNNPNDVVKLKDGTVLKGKITENIDNDYISIRTTDGQVREINYSEITEFYKEKSDINLDEYGGDISIGAAIGGGGLVGIPVRYFITPKMPIEAGVHLRPVNGDDFTWNILLAGTYNYYFNKKFRKYKNRVQMSGLFLNGGYHFGKEYNGTLVGFGWAYERFKRQHKNYSVSFELGVGYEFLRENESQQYDYYPTYSEPETTASPMIFWKVGWNFFVKK